MQRREVLKSGAAIGLLATGWFSTPLLAGLPKNLGETFKIKELDQIIKNLYGDHPITQSNDIILNAPSVAENGAIVPITIESKLANPECMTILVSKNRYPLAAHSILHKAMEPFLMTRVKMADTGDIIAIIKADNKLYKNSVTVKVAAGGCGCNSMLPTSEAQTLLT